MLVLLTGCESGATLVVQVRSDLVPGRELAAVEIELDSSTDRIEASDARDWGRGVRALERSDLAAGQHQLVIRAVDAGGAVIVDRPLRVDLHGGELRVVTVLLTRDCAGVSCPGAADDPLAAACLGGRCVPEECVEEDAAACGEPACAGASDCAVPSAACASAECTASSTCLTVLAHDACAAGEVCSAELGCARAECAWGPFGRPVTMRILTGSGFEEAGPSLSSDGLEIFFTTRDSSGTSNSVARAIRPSRGAAFGGGGVIAELANTDEEGDPSISLDGLRLYFASESRGILVARRPSRAEPFEPAVVVAHEGSGHTYDLGPDISADELLLVYVASDVIGGEGLLYEESRASVDEPFGAVRVIDGLGTVDNLVPALSADGLTLYYTVRDAGRLDLYEATRASRAAPFGRGARITAIPDLGADADLSWDGRELWYNTTSYETAVVTRECL
jgi:hypothetical protein